MRFSKWCLRAALTLPLLALLAVGLRAWQLEGAQLELEYQGSLRSLALGVVSRLERWQSGASWPGERAANAHPATPVVDENRTRDLLVLLGSGFDRALQKGGPEGARSWLDEQLEDASTKHRTWLLLRRASLHRQQGQRAEARAIWRELAKTPNQGRDERGIRFDLTARALLLFERPRQPSIADEAKDLATALATDQRTDLDVGTAVLAARVLEIHATVATEAAHQALLDTTRSRQLDVAWRSLHPSLAQPPNNERLLAYTQQYGGWLLSFSPEATGVERVRGVPRSQLSHDLFGGSTGDLINELGIRIDLAHASGAILATSHPNATNVNDADLLRRDLSGGLGAVLVTVDPMSRTAERRSERRALWLGAIGLAILAALVAGILGLRALRQQERLSAQRDGFVAAVSHELKTPLTATRLLGELLERGGLADAKVREFGGRIARESERLDQLVRNVLDLARVERLGLQTGQISLVAPSHLWTKALDRHRQTVPDSPPAELVAPGTAAWRVHADHESMIGALANLLENGARHAKESNSLDVAVVGAGDRVRMEVRDRGPGVPEAERRRIFGEFYRGGNEDTRTTRGTGIGLALVDRIAIAHHGKAYCEPRAGGGSVFVIELPLRLADIPPSTSNPKGESCT